MYRDDKKSFRKMAHKHVRKSLNIPDEEALDSDEDEDESPWAHDEIVM